MRRVTQWRQVLLAPLLIFGLSGCLGVSLPTQKQPVCSWSSRPPSSANVLCRLTFTTLQSVAAAELKGNDCGIHHLVSNKSVATRIIQYGRSERQNGLQWLHVVPSITLDDVRPGYVGAGFYILGKSRLGRISAPETLYLRVHDGKAVVIADQPAQEW